MKQVIFIVGPTAVGKTGFSLHLAAQLGNVEIISADSRQVYKLMDIGMAKPSLLERAQVVHHFVDYKLPDEYFSAGQFGNEARCVIDALFAGQRTPMVVGGSGLYIRALVDGLFERQVSSDAVKRRLKNEIRENGLTALYERLQTIDAVSAQQIHPNDGHRIVRALEVFELTGLPISEFYKNSVKPISFQPVFIGLNRQRDELYRIIEERVDAMIHVGLVDEVAQLQRAGYGSHLNSMQTVGYREVFDYLEGRCNSSDMIRLIKQRTRNYAKRQLTWFRNDSRIRWFEIDTAEEPRSLVSRVGDYLKSEECPCDKM